MSTQVFDVPAFLEKHGLSVQTEKSQKGGGQLWVLEECPFNPEHTNSAFVKQFANGALAAGCHHNSCDHWKWQDLRSKLDPEYEPNDSSFPPLEDSASSGELPDPIPLIREPEAPEDFPIEALGKILSGAARAIEDATQAPTAICGVSVLIAAAHAVQAHVNVQSNGGERPVSLYAATIAVSGERKTSVDRLAIRPITVREEVLRREYRDKKLMYDLDLEAYEKAKKKATSTGKPNKMSATDHKDQIRKALEELGEPPEPPREPLLLIQDSTTEGVIDALNRGQPSLAWLSSEGGAMLGGHSMREENRLYTTQVYCDLYDGSPINRIRKTDGIVWIRNRRFSMHLMMQPLVANRYLLGDELLNQQGLLSRVFIIFPSSTMGSRLFKQSCIESDENYALYCERLGALLAQPPILNENNPEELQPRTLRLEEAGLAAYRDFHDGIEQQLADKGSLRIISGFANKTSEMMLRVAAVITVVDEPGAQLIPAHQVGNAIELLEHFIGEILRLREAGYGDPDLLIASDLLDWLKEWRSEKGELISAPDVYQLGPSKVRNKAAAQKYMQILVNHHWLVPVDGPVLVAGKKREKAWRIRDLKSD